MSDRDARGPRDDPPPHWVAFFCTDPAATVADVLEAVAGRFSLEVTFRDLKDVAGAGREQVRRVRASVGAFHVCLWTFTMTAAWAWGRGSGGLVGQRAASPWADGSRRPSHAGKRRELVAEQIHAVLRPGLTGPESQAAAERLLDLAARS